MLPQERWVIESAKNGDLTLKFNDIYIYSKYRPIEDVLRLINTVKDNSVFLMVGLGLGYHLDAILNKHPESHIYVLPIDAEDKRVFETYASNHLKESKNVTIVSNIPNITLNEHNVIIPIQWIKALDASHPLKEVLEDIKIRQMTNNNSKNILVDNFAYSDRLDSLDLRDFKDRFQGKTGCLVSAGPSLNDTIELLKAAKNKFFILAVNSSLKVLDAHKIVPDAVIMSDGSPLMINHFKDVDLEVPLFYLATSSKEVLQMYKGDKIKLYQHGYELSEKAATINNQPLFEVGGSVATLGFSLLNYLGFSNIILFGQDLGFRDGHTHAKGSTSGINISAESELVYNELEAYDGKKNQVSRSLMVFWRWFNKNVPLSKAQVYNTAFKGTKINGAKYISPNEYDALLMKQKQNLNLNMF